MKTERFALQVFLLAAGLFATAPDSHAQGSTPLRTYTVSGSENTRYYDPTIGWVVSAQNYTGTLDLVSLTEARFTKVYADGTSVVRDLILQWTVDLNAPAQGGAAAELPDPNDPIIERTTYVIGLQTDGVRYTMSATFKTLAYLRVIPTRWDWYQVAYGDFSGFVVSPLGNYAINGSEQAGKTVSAYSGTFALLSPTTAQLTKVLAGGTRTTVHLALATAVDLKAASQTITATQIENQPGQTTSYSVNLGLNGTLYDVTALYQTTANKSRKTVAIGSFSGTQ